MSFLELSDGNFLSLIEICGIGMPSPVVWIIVVHVTIVACRTAAGHAFHIEDGVGVDYGDYWYNYEARSCRNQ